MMIKYIDLFAGIGGFHYGFDRVNETKKKRVWEKNKEKVRSGENRREDEKHKGLDDCKTKLFKHINRSSVGQFTCVYSNEYDKYANSIYKKHFGECDIRDIREVKAEELPEFDLLCGGFPCQSFSIAGKRRGFEDTRGTLFFEIARIIKQRKPRLLLLENVKGLLSHDKGRTFTTIISTLDELGYDCQWQVLNSKNFGVPQNRERVFIVGHLRGTPRPQVFPIGGTNKEDSRNVGEDLSYCLDNNYHKGTNTLAKGRRQMVALTERRTEEAKRLRREGKVKDTRSLKRLEPRDDGLANTVTTGDVKNQSLTDGVKIRRLTPTECERLQGFPDGWTEGLSDTQRYKCLGNAVTTNVITEIGKKLI